MIYKKQIKKALSRGLRGKTNNVPGFIGRIFHKIGHQASQGRFDPAYCRFDLFDSLDEYAVAIDCGETYFVLDLKTFFYDTHFVKQAVK